MAPGSGSSGGGGGGSGGAPSAVGGAPEGRARWPPRHDGRPPRLPPPPRRRGGGASGAPSPLSPPPPPLSRSFFTFCERAGGVFRRPLRLPPYDAASSSPPHPTAPAAVAVLVPMAGCLTAAPVRRPGGSVWASPQGGPWERMRAGGRRLVAAGGGGRPQGRHRAWHLRAVCWTVSRLNCGWVGGGRPTPRGEGGVVAWARSPLHGRHAGPASPSSPTKLSAPPPFPSLFCPPWSFHASSPARFRAPLLVPARHSVDETGELQSATSYGSGSDAELSPPPPPSQ